MIIAAKAKGLSFLITLLVLEVVLSTAIESGSIGPGLAYLMKDWPIRFVPSRGLTALTLHAKQLEMRCMELFKDGMLSLQ